MREVDRRVLPLLSLYPPALALILIVLPATVPRITALRDERVVHRLLPPDPALHVDLQQPLHERLRVLRHVPPVLGVESDPTLQDGLAHLLVRLADERGVPAHHDVCHDAEAPVVAAPVVVPSEYLGGHEGARPDDRGHPRLERRDVVVPRDAQVDEADGQADVPPVRPLRPLGVDEQYVLRLDVPVHDVA